MNVLNSFSQKNDSLYKIWLDESQSDSIRIRKLYSLCYNLMSINPDSSEKLSRIGLEYLKKINHKSEEPDFLNVIGGCAFYKGNSSKALDYYSKAIELYTKLDRTASVGSIYTNIASIYFTNNDLTKAVEYFKKGLSYIDTSNKRNNYSLSMIYMNMASTYSTMKDYNSALSYYLLSLKLAEERKDTATTANTMVQMINFYLNASQLDSAKRLLDKVKPLLDDKNNTFSLLFYNLYYGNYYSNTKSHLKSFPYYYKAYNLAYEIDYAEAKKDACWGLYSVYNEIGKSDSALKYHLKYITWRDTLMNKEMAENILRRSLGDEYKTQKALDDKENQLQIHKAEEKEKQQKIITNSTVIVLFLVAVFALIVFNRLKVTRKQKAEIQKQKHLVEDKQKEILDSIHYAQRIQKSMLPSEKYIARNIHKSEK